MVLIHINGCEWLIMSKNDPIDRSYVFGVQAFSKQLWIKLKSNV